MTYPDVGMHPKIWEMSYTMIVMQIGLLLCGQMKKKSIQSCGIYFPEWELSIEICHGTWISWNGISCGHCSTVPNVVEGDQFLSLFCSIPRSLCNHLMAKAKVGEYYYFYPLMQDPVLF